MSAGGAATLAMKTSIRLPSNGMGPGEAAASPRCPSGGVSAARAAASPVRSVAGRWDDERDRCGGVPAAGADAACVRQSLERLRLDMEAVFDKHRELWRQYPDASSGPRAAVAESADRVPDQVLHHHHHPISPKKVRFRDTGRTVVEHISSNRSAKSDEGMTRIRKLQTERNLFLTQEDKNWMHTLVTSSHKSWISRCSMWLPGSRIGTFSSVRKTTDFVSKLVRHPGYQLARGMMMLLDAVLVVWEMQYAAQRATSSIHNSLGGIEDATILSAFMDISCVMFVTDLLLGFTAGLLDPTISTGHGWQDFHVVVVIAQLLQTIGQHSHQHQRSYSQFRVVLAMLSTLRLARLLSLVLVTDVIRQHPFFRELRIMIHSLTGAVKGFLWSSLLIFTILLIFGTVLSEGTLAFLVQSGGEDSSAGLQARFGSLFLAVLTLFQAVSGGVDWHEVWQILDALGWGYRGVFLLYIGFSFLTLLNVVTAVLIEGTLMRCTTDRGLVVQSELMAKRDFLQAMRKVFRELDVDEDGDITVEELRGRMKEPEIGAYFSQLGVDSDQVGKLFLLLDRDKSGTLDPEEFMFGCLKLRGAAKNLDVAVLHQEVQWIHETLEIVVANLKPAGLRNANARPVGRFPHCGAETSIELSPFSPLNIRPSSPTSDGAAGARQTPAWMMDDFDHCYTVGSSD
ncbi:unnamed protein product [Prorocentrum cordatum]|uniref:EF-hand domain-containing protein n=1 Tax=Prorocentrum cordatum TaxID=2364126 RepID=A0ABN9T086_9DINO|nr:unnamed protein product [Polarella glacialis]